MVKYSEQWFRDRLDTYLKERHPYLVQREQLIQRRSAVAVAIFRHSSGQGSSETYALHQADMTLFRGLLFSKFDVINLTLANDFPDIPEEQRRTVAKALLAPCEPIFDNYGLGDDFSTRPEFRQLKDELKISIRNWIDDNGPPGYEAKLRHKGRIRKTLIPFIKKNKE